MTTDAARIRAARALAQGFSQAKSAAEAGKDRSTIKRWLKDPAFLDLLQEQKELLAAPDPLEASAEKGLGSLVPQAIELLEQALSGAGTVSATKARVALDIVKTAATLRHEETAADAPSSLASLIEKLDERSPGSD